MLKVELEYCFLCGHPTDKAGIQDDSIYCDCGEGPFCDNCWDKHCFCDERIRNEMNQ